MQKLSSDVTWFAQSACVGAGLDDRVEDRFPLTDTNGIHCLQRVTAIIIAMLSNLNALLVNPVFVARAAALCRCCARCGGSGFPGGVDEMDCVDEA